MAILRRSKPRVKRKTRAVKTIKIQGIEGGQNPVQLESAITATRVNLSIPGTTNAFKTYEGQVTEMYRKYNGWADFGNAQTRSAVDFRTSFIAGEGISISAKNDATAKWIEDFLDKNKLKGEAFINAVKGTEMAGQTILMLRPKMWDDETIFVKVTRIPYIMERPFRPIYVDPFIKDELEAIEFKVDGLWKRGTLGNFIYIRTGGDDFDSRGPTTKTGVVLTDIENYDRALRDMRRNNHIFARITPTFETETEGAAKTLKAKLQQTRWQIGQAFVGNAKFKYETPDRGAHENLKMEMVATIKSISGTTGIPVHWMGYVDLMSNRATADSLYEVIKNATINERTSWERAMYETIIKAQEVYINAGGTELPALDRKIEVKLPLIDFSQFLERVRALSLAFHDEAISMDDYRNQLPGIDPLKTERMVEIEQKEAEENLVRMGVPLIPTEDDEDGEEN